MKKTIFLAILLFYFSHSFAWVKSTTTKSNGGLFGYKSVSENLSGPPLTTDCTFTLECMNPGTASCKFTQYDMKTPLFGAVKQ